MTEEEFERLVRGANPQALVEAMAPLEEKERGKLSKKAASLLRAAKAEDAGSQTGSRHFLQLSRLAVLGVCPWTQARQITTQTWGWGGSEKGEQGRICAVLKARKPEWIDRWVEQELAGEFGDWSLIRRLVREEICAKPTADGYIVWMVRTSAGHGHIGKSKGALVDHLRADPGLLTDELWRIFEVDLGRQTAFYEGPIISEGIFLNTWSDALAALSESGEMDRSRLLTASLRALNRPIQASNASWFYKFHEKLAPTLSERIERQTLYLDLLGSLIPAVVGFALDALKLIAKAGKLDVPEFIRAVGPVFDLRPKSHPAAAILMLVQAARTDTTRRAEIATVTMRGLAHAQVDVQKAAADLIADLVTESDAELAAGIELHLDSVAASLRPQLGAIVARLNPARSAEENIPSDTPPDADSGDALAALVQEASDVPEPWRSLAGIDECLAAIRDGTLRPPLKFNPMSVPRLDADARLMPIATFDELVERFSAAIEGTDSAEELELILNGINQLADQSPADFDVRVAPLAKRAEKLIGQSPWGTRTADPQVRLRMLAVAWASGQPAPLPQTSPGVIMVSSFLVLRMVMLSRRARRRLAGPLLATPTHKGGWIDPVALVERAIIWQSIGKTFVPSDADETLGSVGYDPTVLTDSYDLIQALLRLAPDGRSAALSMAAPLEGKAGAAIRFALGGDESIGKHSGLWVAAARARDPFGTFPELSTQHGDLGPDAAHPARYSWNMKVVAIHPPGPRLEVQLDPPLTEAHRLANLPLALLHTDRRHDWSFDNILNIRCRCAVWPANPEACLLRGARVMTERIQSGASTFTPTAPYLEPLFDPDTAFTESAQLALTIALVSKDPGARGLAVDALIALIADGRCAGEEFGLILGKLTATEGIIRLNRLAESLTDVARVSPRHARLAGRITFSAILALKLPLPADLHHLLTPLREWLIATNEPLPAPIATVLATIKGAGKTATLANAILSNSISALQSPKDADAVALLTAQVARALRWAERSSASP